MIMFEILTMIIDYYVFYFWIFCLLIALVSYVCKKIIRG